MIQSRALLTFLALVAFAANSLLCRKALGNGSIDAASFTTIRLTAGAVVLWILVRLQKATASGPRVDFFAAAWLFVYAAAFSFAYLSLSVGTGALILFAAVQFTMITAGYRAGEQLSALTLSGLILSFAGLVYLVSPGLAAPPLQGAALMASAGVAWGLYSLRSRGEGDPLRKTAQNFLAAMPLALIVNAAFLPMVSMTPNGVLLAVVSGAVTSGLGYVVWYAALRRLTSTVAASVQLAVPVLATLGGVLLLGEQFTVRLVIAAVVILTGIALVLRSRAARK